MSYESRGNTGLAGRMGTSRTGDRPSLGQTFALVFGVTFLLIDIAGFIPGLTSHYDELTFLAAAREQSSVIYLIGGGLAYGLVTLYGFVIDQNGDASFLPALGASRRAPARA